MPVRFTGCERFADNEVEVGSIPAAGTEGSPDVGMLDEKCQRAKLARPDPRMRVSPSGMASRFQRETRWVRFPLLAPCGIDVNGLACDVANVIVGVRIPHTTPCSLSPNGRGTGLKPRVVRVRIP